MIEVGGRVGLVVNTFQVLNADPGVDRRGAHLDMAQDFLKEANVPAVFAVEEDGAVIRRHHQRLQRLRVFFRWLSRQNVVLANPAADLELPRVPRRLPKAILTEREVEKVFAIADTTDPIGLRDRAMMEVLYSTGIRRAELAGLQLYDIDGDRGTVTVREGKGRKDRVVPIGERALHWMGRYIEEVRPELVVPPDDGTSSCRG